MIEICVRERTSLFNHVLGLKDSRKHDFTKGNNCCFKFVTSIMRLNELCDTVHSLGKGAITDMLHSGWYKIDKPARGCVVVYKPIVHIGGDGNKHEHIGFYNSPKVVISHRYEYRCPVRHHLIYFGGNTREVEAYYWHKKLKH